MSLNYLGIAQPIISTRIKPTLNDIYWAAGFIEGEGTFLCGDKAKKWRYFRVQVPQVNIEPLHKLKNLFGGNIASRGASKCCPNRNEIYQWTISGKAALGLGLTLFTLMSKKRQEQIKKSLALVIG